MVASTSFQSEALPLIGVFDDEGEFRVGEVEPLPPSDTVNRPRIVRGDDDECSATDDHPRRRGIAPRRDEAVASPLRSAGNEFPHCIARETRSARFHPRAISVAVVQLMGVMSSCEVIVGPHSPRPALAGLSGLLSTARPGVAVQTITGRRLRPVPLEWVAGVKCDCLWIAHAIQIDGQSGDTSSSDLRDSAGIGSDLRLLPAAPEHRPDRSEMLKRLTVGAAGAVATSPSRRDSGRAERQARPPRLSGRRRDPKGLEGEPCRAVAPGSFAERSPYRRPESVDDGCATRRFTNWGFAIPRVEGIPPGPPPARGSTAASGQGKYLPCRRT